MSVCKSIWEQKELKLHNIQLPTIFKEEIHNSFGLKVSDKAIHTYIKNKLPSHMQPTK
jgi:hypothetical protein